MSDPPPTTGATRALSRLLAWVVRNPAVRGVASTLDRLSEIGTAGYEEEDRRRLKILNMIALLIVLTTGGYAIQHSLVDYETYRPIVLINAGLLVVAATLPVWHRLGPIAAALVLVGCEYVALFALSAYLSRDAGVQLQYFIGAAAAFVVLGLGRLWLVLVVILAGLGLKIGAWFAFPPESAFVIAEQDVIDGIYTQAAITTMMMIAATVWYAFRLAETARAETDALLHKILPIAIVRRMKAQPAEPIADTFDDASVLFADISGFVPLSRALGAPRVVALLNRIVTEFDALAARHGIEKIKTIGDAYMAAGGLPERASDHLERMVAMAIDMLAAIARLREETGLDVKVRIGIASGPVMAGVIGTNKFSYDVWGDTVNLASRLEGRSTPGRILTCPNCRDRLAATYDLESAGVMDIKGVGARETWLVVGAKAAASL